MELRIKKDLWDVLGLVIAQTSLRINAEDDINIYGSISYKDAPPAQKFRIQGNMCNAKGDILYVLSNAEILIHQPLGGTSGQASDMKIHVEHILGVREKLNRILAECTAQTVEKIAADTERDKLFCASEALAYGLIDHIGDPFAEQ